METGRAGKLSLTHVQFKMTTGIPYGNIQEAAAA